MNRKILIIGISVHLLAAIFSIGFNNHDEHFQILEFAALKLNLTTTNDMPWEFGYHMRSTVQPAIAYLVVNLSELFGLNNPFSQAAVLRIISALLALLCMYLLIKSFGGEVKSAFLKEWFVFLSFLLWFLPYIHARFSSENWAGLAFWIGVALLILPKPRDTDDRKNHFNKPLVGILLGFSFTLKFQMGFVIAGLILWLIIIRKEKPGALFMLIFGILIPIVIEIFVDRWFYGEWSLAAWNYFKVNIIQGKVSEFGINPWWYYFYEIFLKAIPPFSILIITNAILFWVYYPKHIVTWITVPFVLVHSLIGHKDVRFLFPLVNILPFILVISFQVIEEDPRFARVKDLFTISKKYIVWTFVAVNSILLLVACFKPADSSTPLYRYIYDHYNSENTVLVYDKENPYFRGNANLHFYKPQKLSIMKIGNPGELHSYALNAHKEILFATRKFELNIKIPGIHCSKVYQTLPAIVEHLNFNNWLARTRHWTLYECASGQIKRAR